MLSSYLFQRYRVGSTVLGWASIVAYYTKACNCALFSLLLKDLSVGGKYCKKGAVFLALDFFVYQGMILHLIIDSCWNMKSEKMLWKFFLPVLHHPFMNLVVPTMKASCHPWAFLLSFYSAHYIGQQCRENVENAVYRVQPEKIWAATT